MYIEALSHYLPEKIIPNDYFLNVNGLTNDWIIARTGIKTRRKAATGENTNTMAIEAVKNLQDQNGDLTDIDLIIGASYAPFDTVATIAHVVQKEFSLSGAKAIYLSSACSSFINAVEIVEGYFAVNKASRALIIASEHNTAYGHEDDEKSGHLWGDGAAAILISKENEGNELPCIMDVYTEGLGHIGKGPEGVYLQPGKAGLIMPFGKDVFVHACNYMISSLKEIVKKHVIDIEDLDYIIPHQANTRIINYISQQIGFPEHKVIVNIDKYGNTGSASTLIGLSENRHLFKKDDIIGCTVFGGGYSTGSMLIRY
jgi:3-oxoacyl-[acyl-carrier-protein] synthase-3